MFNVNKKSIGTRKKTTHNSAKDKSFGLAPLIVKMLPQKWESFS